MAKHGAWSMEQREWPAEFSGERNKVKFWQIVKYLPLCFQEHKKQEHAI
jgi:hypothetical protein